VNHLPIQSEKRLLLLSLNIIQEFSKRYKLQFTDFKLHPQHNQASDQHSAHCTIAVCTVQYKLQIHDYAHHIILMYLWPIACALCKTMKPSFINCRQMPGEHLIKSFAFKIEIVQLMIDVTLTGELE